MVLKADAVVYKGAVVLVIENTTVAHTAMTSPSRLHVIASDTFPLNKVEIIRRLVSILQELLHFLRNTIKPIIFDAL